MPVRHHNLKIQVYKMSLTVAVAQQSPVLFRKGTVGGCNISCVYIAHTARSEEQYLAVCKYIISDLLKCFLLLCDALRPAMCQECSPDEWISLAREYRLHKQNVQNEQTKSTIHQATTTLATSKMSYFLAITTG